MYDCSWAVDNCSEQTSSFGSKPTKDLCGSPVVLFELGAVRIEYVWASTGVEVTASPTSHSTMERKGATAHNRKKHSMFYEKQMRNQKRKECLYIYRF